MLPGYSKGHTRPWCTYLGKYSGASGRIRPRFSRLRVNKAEFLFTRVLSRSRGVWPAVGRGVLRMAVL